MEPWQQCQGFSTSGRPAPAGGYCQPEAGSAASPEKPDGETIEPFISAPKLASLTSSGAARP